jgi:stage III sporulation protein AH
MEDYLDEDMEVVEVDTKEESPEVAEVTPEAGEIPGEAVFTSTPDVTVLSEAKLLKEQTRAKNKETLMEIIDSTGLTDAQKQEAVDSMVQMTEYAEQEAAAEILLEAKGFSDVVVSISAEGVDVVVNAAELTDAQRAQIEDIVTRKTETAAEDIVISTVAR